MYSHNQVQKYGTFTLNLVTGFYLFIETMIYITLHKVPKHCLSEAYNGCTSYTFLKNNVAFNNFTSNHKLWPGDVLNDAQDNRKEADQLKHHSLHLFNICSWWRAKILQTLFKQNFRIRFRSVFTLQIHTSMRKINTMPQMTRQHYSLCTYIFWSLQHQISQWSNNCFS